MTSPYVTQTYPIECKGRTPQGTEALEDAVAVLVNISKSPGSNMLSATVTCPYNGGGHGDRCLASTAKADCVYSFDVPYAFDLKAELRVTR